MDEPQLVWIQRLEREAMVIDHDQFDNFNIVALEVVILVSEWIRQLKENAIPD